MKPQNKFLLPAFCFIFAFCFLLSAAAVDRITATVTITNTAGTTNGQTFIVNGNTRTFTNAVFNPLTQVLTNSTHLGSKTNLFNAIASVPFNSVTLLNLGTNQFSLIGAAGLSMTVTPSAGYATVSYSTQLVSSLTPVRVPIAAEPSGAVQTSIASLLTLGIWTYSTNPISQSSITASNLLGTTNSQTITGDKTFSGITVITNPAAIFYAGTISNAANISGTANAISNGVFWTNSFSSPAFTNGQNFGAPFRSPGIGLRSEQFGVNSAALADDATAIGNNAVAASSLSTSIGMSATSSNTSASAFGSSTIAMGQSSTAIGKSATAIANGTTALGAQTLVDTTHNNSTAVGISSTTTTSNQVRLGTSSEYVSIPGGLKVDGIITNAVFGNTNSFPAGSDISFGRYPITSLANGNNAGIIVGTNVFIEVSGPSAAFAICGIGGGRDGKLIYIVNQTGFDMTISHQSGVDATAANRIITMTGADRATTGNGTATLIYSASASRWLLLNFDP